jgi:hypothetical protein
MADTKKLNDLVASMDLDEADKKFLMDKLSDDSLSDDEKAKAITDFVAKQSNKLDDQLKEEKNKVIDEVNKELNDAEEGYKIEMQSLEKEVEDSESEGDK